MISAFVDRAKHFASPKELPYTIIWVATLRVDSPTPRLDVGGASILLLQSLVLGVVLPERKVLINVVNWF